MKTLHSFEPADIKSILSQLLHYVRTITNSDAGTIYIKDGDYLKFIIAQNDTLNQDTLKNKKCDTESTKLPLTPQSNFVAVQSFNQQKIINIKDLYQNQKFNFDGVKKFDTLFGYKTLSMVTFPLAHPFKKEMIGVLQIINKKSHNGFLNYNQNDIKLVSSISLFTGYLVSKIEIIKEKEPLLDKKNIFDIGTNPTIIIGGFSYDFQTKLWSDTYKTIRLSKSETKLMEVLIGQRGKVFALDELEWQVSPFKAIGKVAIKNYVFKIRKKLTPDIIKTVGTLGYMVE
jgi:hypothetical protein